MFTKTLHFYSRAARQIREWDSSDQEDRYHKNLETQRDLLEKYNWIDKTFTYRFNKYGFRSEEFSLEPSVMSFGCSHTMGTGLPEENTWAHLVSAKLGLKNFNLGIAGGSNDSSFRLAHNWIHQLKPKIVVLMVTHTLRLEVIDGDNTVHQYIAGYTDDNSKDLLWNRWIMNDINSDTNVIKNTMAMQHLCSSQGIKLIVTNHMLGQEIDLARDLLHPGIETNKICADDILSKLS